MPNISISAYVITVNRRHESSFERIDKIDGNSDFMAFIERYLSTRHSHQWRDETRHRVLRVSKIVKQPRYSSGLIKYGEFGRNIEVRDVYRDATVYNQNEHEAGLNPHYYLFHVPVRRDRAFLITQSSGALNPVSAMRVDIVSEFNRLFPDFHITFRPCLPQSVFLDLIKGGDVLELEYLSATTPKQPANAIRIDPSTARYKVTFSAKEGFGPAWLKKIIAHMKSNQDVSSFIGMSELGCDDVRIKFETVKGSPKSVKLSKLLQIKPNFDVTDSVSLEGGNPTFDSIDDVARDWMSTISKQVEEEEQDVSQN
jgi:hypothetical protein